MERLIIHTNGLSSIGCRAKFFVILLHLLHSFRIVQIFSYYFNRYGNNHTPDSIEKII